MLAPHPPTQLKGLGKNMNKKIKVIVQLVIIVIAVGVIGFQGQKAYAAMEDYLSFGSDEYAAEIEAGEAVEEVSGETDTINEGVRGEATDAAETYSEDTVHTEEDKTASSTKKTAESDQKSEPVKETEEAESVEEEVNTQTQPPQTKSSDDSESEETTGKKSEPTSAVSNKTENKTTSNTNKNNTTTNNKETTKATETKTPETKAPETKAPETQAPATEAPTTQAPTTQAPTTQAPTTAAPETPAPTTAAPAPAFGVGNVAGMMNGEIINAFNNLGFSVSVTPSAGYAGVFSPSRRLIDLQTTSNASLLHELGHFVSFIKLGAADTEEFKGIYAAEKAAYTGGNAAYITQSPGEYFAESFRDFCENPGALQASRPRTYEYVARMANSVSAQDVTNVRNTYGM